MTWEDIAAYPGGLLREVQWICFCAVAVPPSWKVHRVYGDPLLPLLTPHYLTRAYAGACVVGGFIEGLSMVGLAGSIIQVVPYEGFSRFAEVHLEICRKIDLFWYGKPRGSVHSSFAA